MDGCAEGPFASGIFRFVVETDETFPSTMPVVRFTTPLFHPLVDPLTGELDTSAEFPVWRPDSIFIYHILQFMKNVLIRGDDPALVVLRGDAQQPSTARRGGRRLPRNARARDLLLTDRDAYLARAAESVAASTRFLYDEPDSEIRFYPWDLDVHQRR
nr:hypothetical protein HK105_005333 [Polyrhizophydium stewartii]